MPEVMESRKGFIKKKFVPHAGAVTELSREEEILLAQKKNAPAQPLSSATSDPLPTGKIGPVEISRLICGGNMIAGYAHTRDLIYVSSMLQKYFSAEKIFETLELCRGNGINTLVTHLTSHETDTRVLDIVNRYRQERGGDIQWIAQCAPFDDRIEDLVKFAVDNGCVGAFLMGAVSDAWTENRQIDKIHQTVDLIKQNGLIAGVAGHSLEVPKACEEQNVNPDFYVKTFHRTYCGSVTPPNKREDFRVDTPLCDEPDKFLDNTWCIDPDETAAFMNTVQKPWIAYKVMAAGAIHPQEAFQYAFEKGADFVLAGMFDFQVTENAIIAKQVLSTSMQRQRPWCA